MNPEQNQPAVPSEQDQLGSKAISAARGMIEVPKEWGIKVTQPPASTSVSAKEFRGNSSHVLGHPNNPANKMIQAYADEQRRQANENKNQPQ